MMADQLVRRVLGPVGPDAGCDRTLELLDELVELESAGRAAPASFAAVTRHLEACPDCREDYEGLRALARGDS
jgi:hypothetical protein